MYNRSHTAGNRVSLCVAKRLHATNTLLIHLPILDYYCAASIPPHRSSGAQRLLSQVRVVRRHRQHTQRVRVAQSTLPALHRDDRGALLDQVQLERVAQTEPDAVVDLE